METNAKIRYHIVKNKVT